MADLRTVTDITIADRLSTKLKNDLTISELLERIAQLEAELLTHRTDIEVNIDPSLGKHSIKVTVKGVAKTIEFTDTDVDSYLGSSSPLLEMINDAAEILSKPYISMLKNELTKPLCAIIENRIDVTKGRKL